MLLLVVLSLVGLNWVCPPNHTTTQGDNIQMNNFVKQMVLISNRTVPEFTLSLFVFCLHAVCHPEIADVDRLHGIRKG